MRKLSLELRHAPTRSKLPDYEGPIVCMVPLRAGEHDPLHAAAPESVWGLQHEHAGRMLKSDMCACRETPTCTRWSSR